MATNVPAPLFGPQGFQAPTDAQILAGVQADMQAAFGGNLNFTTSGGSSVNSTPQGQLASSLTAIISAVYSEFVNFTNQVNPAFAIGRMQDAIGNIYFLQRNPAQATVVQCVCTGLSGTVIPGGSIGSPPAVMAADEGGNQYVCTQGGVIPAGGSITLSFVNIIPGPVPCPENTLTIIYQAIPGWDSINNPTAGVLGNNVETRTAFEARRQATVESNSFGPIAAILGAVSDVPGVLDFYGYNNGSSGPVTVLGVTIPANSIFLCIEGGSSSAVAQAILSKLNPGPGMYGNTTVVAYDNNPLYVAPVAYNITYNIPTDLSVLFSVVIHNGPTVPANAASLIQAAIISAFVGGDGGPRARIASQLFASRYYSAVASVGSWCQIVSIGLGSNNAPDAVFGATISGTALTVTHLNSGTIVLGGTISDSLGRIAEGTTIVSGSGSSWVISVSQTVAGASFTASAGSPTTHLVVTAVTGTINVGDTVVGTGITGGTTILSQLSGTPGGAGTYLLSVANSTSSASCTSSCTTTEATADLNDMQVQANQIPITDENIIYVSVG